MGEYFLSIGTGTIHKKSCHFRNRVNNENYREFSSLKEIVDSTDKCTRICKICMKEENENWNKIRSSNK